MCVEEGGKKTITELLDNKIKPTNKRFVLWLLAENWKYKLYKRRRQIKEFKPIIETVLL